MKNVKTIILALSMLTFAVAQSAKADDNDKLSRNFVINIYLNAVAHGKISGLNNVIDKNAKFSILRNNQLLSFSKDEMMEFLKTTKDIEQNCVTTSTISESNADIAVVKVDMKYNGFTRTNYVTLTNTSDGWKITNIYSVFKNTLS